MAKKKTIRIVEDDAPFYLSITKDNNKKIYRFVKEKDDKFYFTSIDGKEDFVVSKFQFERQIVFDKGYDISKDYKKYL